MQDQTSPQQLQQNIIKESSQFKEEKYRWIIVLLAGCAMSLNGLLNNIIIPIAKKLAITYQQSSRVINLPTILGFLIFSLINIPVNHFLDKRGIKIGYVIGISIYAVGIMLVCFLNKVFPLLIIGFLIFSFGQPFILNLSAKIATYWFLPQNRALATAIMVGTGIVGSGLGFAIPSLVTTQINDKSGQDVINLVKHEVFSLYFGYTITTCLFLVIVFVFFKSKPSSPTSNIEEKQQLSLKQTFSQLKSDTNIWIFISSYCLLYGSFQTFAASANLLIKPYGATDLDISIAAIFLIVFGTVGAIVSSLYLKKTRKYKRVFTLCCLGSLSCITLLVIQLNTINQITLTKINIGILGFFITPIIPVSYQMGCELAFPVGEAQITGILNGGALIWAFLSDSLLTIAVGFDSKGRSIVFMVILIIFIAIGTVLGFMVKLKLKRKEFEQSLRLSDSSSTRASDSPFKKQIELTNQSHHYNSHKTNESQDYQTFQEQK